jgi:hypothetical protein
MSEFDAEMPRKSWHFRDALSVQFRLVFVNPCVPQFSPTRRNHARVDRLGELARELLSIKRFERLIRHPDHRDCINQYFMISVIILIHERYQAW